MIALLLLLSGLASAEADRGYLALMNEVRADMKQFTEDARSQILSPHNASAEKIKEIGQKAPPEGGKLSALSSMYGEGAIVPHSNAKTAADAAVGGWRQLIDAARGKQEEGSRAYRDLSTSSRIRDIDEKLKRVDHELKDDRRVVDEGLGQPTAGVSGDLALYKTHAAAGIQRADKENLKARDDFDKQKKRWTKFLDDLRTGDIKACDDQARTLLIQAQLFHTRAKSAVAGATPGEGESFGTAGSQMNSGSSLSSGNTKYAQAVAAVDAPQGFAP